MTKKLVEVYNALLAVSDLDSDEFRQIIKDVHNIVLEEDAKKFSKDWVRTVGKLRFYTTELEVDVYQNADYPGVMIHRAYTETGKLVAGWSISHSLSGQRITPKIFRSARQAISVFHQYCTGVDWNRPVKEIASCSITREAMQKIT